MQNELTIQPQQQLMRQEMTIADLQHRQSLIQTMLKEVMVPGHHFGVVPGTDGKQTLLKPGAEKLCALFMLAPSFQVVQRDLPNNHREYRVDCTLTHIGSGVIVGQANGSCSTMESKYRWRLASRKCPECQAEAIRKSKNGSGGFFCWAKIGGCGAEFAQGDKRIIGQALGRAENPDIADQYNTVLKMATKRALVAAALIATAASDMFVPDEDEHDEEPEPHTETRKQQVKVEPTQPTAKQLLLKECIGMFEQLQKGGRTREGLVDLLGNAGVVMPAKWGDLAEADLAVVKKAFADELKLGAEVKG